MMLKFVKRTKYPIAIISIILSRTQSKRLEKCVIFAKKTIIRQTSKVTLIWIFGRKITRSWSKRNLHSDLRVGKQQNTYVAWVSQWRIDWFTCSLDLETKKILGKLLRTGRFINLCFLYNLFINIFEY